PCHTPTIANVRLARISELDRTSATLRAGSLAQPGPTSHAPVENAAPRRSTLTRPDRSRPVTYAGGVPYLPLPVLVRSGAAECSRCDPGDTKVGATVAGTAPPRRGTGKIPRACRGVPLPSWAHAGTDRGPGARTGTTGVGRTGTTGMGWGRE